MSITKHKLESGLTVIEDPIKEAKSFTLLVMFRTGSRNETKDIWGISHFLEHMAFKGTPTYPTAELLNKELDSLGAMYNAFTSKEYTGYYIKGSVNVFERAFSIIAEMTTSPIIRDADVDKERGTIIEEINMYEDDPKRKIGEYFEQCIYDDEQLAQEVVGTAVSLADIHAKELIDYRKKYYTGGNAIIAISGFVPAGFKAMVAEGFSSIESGQEKFLPKVSKPTRNVNLCTKETQQTHLAFGFLGTGVLDKDTDAVKILSIILGGNMSSRMFSEIREKRGLAYYVRTYSDNMHEAGSFVTFAGINNEKVYDAVKIIKEVYASVLDGVPEEELRRAKDYVSGIITLQYEDSEYRSESLALEEVFGEELKGLDQRLKEVEKVTADDIKRVAKRIIDFDNPCLALIGPFKNPEKFDKILRIKSK